MNLQKGGLWIYAEELNIRNKKGTDTLLLVLYHHHHNITIRELAMKWKGTFQINKKKYFWKQLRQVEFKILKAFKTLKSFYIC